MNNNGMLTKLLRASISHPGADTLADTLRETPFQSEEEYWELARFRFELLIVLKTSTQARSGVIGDDFWEKIPVFGRTNGDSCKAVDPSFESRVHGALEVAENLLGIEGLIRNEEEKALEILRSRIALSPDEAPTPRILRLAKRLKLTQEDLDILSLMILANSEHTFLRSNRILRLSWEVKDLADLLVLPSDSFFRLLSERHPLYAHELVTLEAGSFGRWRDSELRIDKAVVKFLRGLDLDGEDLLSLGEGVVQELLQEEGGEPSPAGLSPVTVGTGETLSENLAGMDPTDLRSEALNSDGEHLTEERGDEFDIDSFIQEALWTHDPAPAVSDADEEAPSAGPYHDDLEYLTHHLEWFGALAKLRGLEGDDVLRSMRDEMSPAARRREARAKARAIKGLIDQRITATKKRGQWSPRAEHLAESRGLLEFEKHLVVFLAAKRASTRFDQIMGQNGFSGSIRSWTVGGLLHLFFDDLQSQVEARRFFYRDAALIRDQILDLSTGVAEDLLEANVEIDRRMTDFLLGLDVEASNQVEGSILYSPKVSLDRVFIPDTDRDLIVRTVEQFPAFQRARRKSGMEDLLTYGGGLVLLFHGPSGTGKTMMANALGHHLGKRIFLINVSKASASGVRWVFREAKIQDCILFFDECEEIFADRRFNPTMTGILSEIERHDGLVILATNRPSQLDEAMHRRITLAVEFRKPDVGLRERIWMAHQPPKLQLEGDLDLRSLAFDFELTGGLIKNAWVAALALATGRDPDHPSVSQSDLELGARQQLRGGLQLSAIEDCIVPRKHLRDLVLPKGLRTSLGELVGREKARKTLIGQWGFEADDNNGLGTKGLFHGPPGTGKTAAAEAVASELGRVLKRINAAHVVSKWVGDGAKNIHAIFSEARRHDAVLLFDEADALFGGRTGVASSTDRYANLEVSVLLQALETFNGTLILTTNLLENVDSAFLRRVGFVLEFPMPDENARREIWRKTLPASLPLADDVDIPALAARYSLSGAQIRNAVVKAASRAALRHGDERKVSHDDLRNAASEEARLKAVHERVGF